MSHFSGSKLFRWTLLVAMCAALSAMVFAQSSVTGAIAGTIVDQSKAVVTGAKIAVANSGTNLQWSATSDSQGTFHVVELQPGTYRISVEAAEFASPPTRTVIVEVGRVTTIEIALAVAGKTETVEVNAEAPLVNTVGQEFTSNVNQTTISNVPVANRRWSTFALFTPGVVPDGPYYLLSFRGISGLLNNSTVDGGDNNDAFWSEERGRTRAPYTISGESVQEFQVNTSDYSAEYGRAAGAVVNSVTKSGTNQIHGEAFYFNRNNALGATNPFTKEYVESAPGAYTSVPYQPEDNRQQFGGNVGGALIKDKLFYFFNYDGQLRNFPLTAAPSSTTFFNAPSTSTLGTLAGNLGLCSGTTACNTYVGANQTKLTGYYNNFFNFIQAESGTVPRTGNQNIFFPKLDWVINKKNTFTASYNRQRWSSPGGIQTGANVADGIDSIGSDYVHTDMVNGRLTSTLTTNLSNELRYSFGRDFQFETAQTPSPIELQYNLVSPLTGAVPNFSTGSGGLYGGSPNYLPRAAYPDETRHQFADSMSWVHGKHFVKWGVDLDRSNDVLSNLYNGVGNYSYSTQVSFVTDLTLLANPGVFPGVTTNHWSSYSQAFGPQAITYHTWDYSGFLQDSWKVLPRFTLNVGVRYEYEKLPAVQYANPNWTPTQTMPSDKNNIGPRIGFAFDVFGDAKTILRGGYGLYYGRINNSAIEAGLFQTGAPGTQISYTEYGPGLAAPTFPNLLASAGSLVGGTPTITYLDPHLQNPQVHEFDMVLEHEILPNTVFSISYLGSLGRELPNFVDTNIAPSTSTQSYIFNGGPFNGQTYTIPFYSSRFNLPDCYNGVAYTKCGAMVDMLSNVNSSYNALVGRLTRRMRNGLQFDMSYTWAHAIDNGQNSTTQIPTSSAVYDPYNQALQKGSSTFDVRQRFVATVAYQPQYFSNSGKLTKTLLNGWNLAPVITAQTGHPYSEYVSGNALTSTGSSVTSASGGIDGAGTTDSRLAHLLGKNSFRYPNFANIDMRLSRKFKLTERQSLEFMAEAFNLFNSLQVSGLNTTAYTTAKPSTAGGPTILTYQSAANNASSIFGQTTGASTNLFAPRQIQLGIRYSF